MPFPRTLGSELWYLRLPTGEIELVSRDDLVRAFRAGLVDARTTVRACDSPIWMRLEEAAGLDRRSHFPSDAPMTLDDPAPDLADGAPWTVRRHVDERRFHRRGGRVIAAFAFALVTIIVGGTLGVKNHARAAAANAVRPMPTAVVTATAPPRTGVDMLHPKADPRPPRLTPAQIRRERDEEIIKNRRMKGWKARGGPMSSTPFRALLPGNDGVAPRAGVASEARRWDPLDPTL